MSDASLDDLIQRALSFGILTPGQIQEMWATVGTRDIDSERFLQETIRCGFLTNYQVERLASGESSGFFFGDYKVLYHVGAGTFARVYRATHKDTGKIVAVKVLRSRFYDDPNIINHFIHEAELGMELRHPNIVPIYEVNSGHRLHYMVMDFVEGQTLREFLRVQRKIDPKITTRIMIDICSGLDYASKRGLQHRDLKLSNVLLSSMGKAMLVDFGLATIAENAELGNAEIRNQRSIDYAALERTTGVKRDDPRSDIYFLGCMYYHLLTGEAPLLETKDRSKRLDKNRFYNVKPIQRVDSMIPGAVVLVVNKAMSLEVGKRYQSMGEMLTDLEICGRRLADGTANEGISMSQIDQGLAQSAPAIPKGKQKSIMIVDSNVELQGVFRESLKKAGYRVLVASSADRAVDRVLDDISVVDTVIYNAQSLGQSAVKGFNKLASDDYSKRLPMIILLDEKQGDFEQMLEKDEHRVALKMPITMKILKENINRLIGPITAADAAPIPNAGNVHLQPLPSWLAPVDVEEEQGFLVHGPKSEAEEDSEFFEQIMQSDDFATSETDAKTAESADREDFPVVELTESSEPDEGSSLELQEYLEEEQQDEEHETDEEEDEEVDDEAPTVKSFGYKEVLAERDDEADPIADALFEAHVPPLIKAKVPHAEPNVETVESPAESPVEPSGEHETDAFPIVETPQKKEEDSESVQPFSEETPKSEDLLAGTEDIEKTDVLEMEFSEESTTLAELEQSAVETLNISETTPREEEAPKSLEELRDAVNAARLRYAEAIRSEEDISRGQREIAQQKSRAEENSRVSQKELEQLQSRVEDVFNTVAESTIAYDSVAAMESESRELLEEAARVREETQKQLEEASLAAEQAHKDLEEHEKRHLQVRDDAHQALSTIAESEEKLVKAERLKEALESAGEKKEQLEKEWENARSVLGEMQKLLEGFMETFESCNARLSHASESVVLATAEYEAASAVESDSKTNAEQLRIQAEDAMNKAVEMEKLAEEAEEEARKAAQRAAEIRNESVEAMVAAGDARLKAEAAVDEVVATELFVNDSKLKAEQARQEEEGVRERLQTLEQERNRLALELSEKTEAAQNQEHALERARELWEQARAASEEAESELALILSDVEAAQQVQDDLVRISTDSQLKKEFHAQADQHLEEMNLKAEQAVKEEEERRVQLEKIAAECEEYRNILQVTSAEAEAAQHEWDAAREKHEQFEKELRSAIEREQEVLRLSREKAEEKEKARKAAEAAQRALSDFSRNSSGSSKDPGSSSDGFTETGSVGSSESTSVGDRVAAAIRARVEAALAARNKSGD